MPSKHYQSMAAPSLERVCYESLGLITFRSFRKLTVFFLKSGSAGGYMQEARGNFFFSLSSACRDPQIRGSLSPHPIQMGGSPPVSKLLCVLYVCPIQTRQYTTSFFRDTIVREVPAVYA